MDLLCVLDVILVALLLVLVLVLLVVVADAGVVVEVAAAVELTAVISFEEPHAVNETARQPAISIASILFLIFTSSG